MADPIVKIRRKTNGSSLPTGMSLGEPALNFTNNSFYVINGSGQAITFGSEIDNSTTLSSNSDNKVASQYAVKTFVDSSNTSGGLQSALRTSNANINLPNITNTIIPFDVESYNTISGLNYFGGTFTNNSGATMCVHIAYHVPFFRNSAITASSLGSRHTWIQTNGDPSKSKYGICYETSSLISVGGNYHTNSGSFILALSPSMGFSICASWQGGTASAFTVGVYACNVSR